MLDREELKKIDAAKSALVTSILAGDAEAYATCCTPDGILTMTAWPMKVTRAAIGFGLVFLLALGTLAMPQGGRGERIADAKDPGAN